jgi:hypothetical protein
MLHQNLQFVTWAIPIETPLSFRTLPNKSSSNFLGKEGSEQWSKWWWHGGRQQNLCLLLEGAHRNDSHSPTFLLIQKTTQNFHWLESQTAIFIFFFLLKKTVCVRYTTETGPTNFVFYPVTSFLFAKNYLHIWWWVLKRFPKKSWEIIKEWSNSVGETAGLQNVRRETTNQSFQEYLFCAIKV